MSVKPVSLWAAAGSACAASGASAVPASLPPVRRRLATADQEARAEAQALIARLRETVERMDGSAHRLPELRAVGRVRQQRPIWGIGLETVDRHLPARGLPLFAVHDVAPQQSWDAPASMGFALALARRAFDAHVRKRPILWCRIETEQREQGRLYGRGLDQMGLQRQHFLTLTLRKPKALFWVLEEALKSQCLSVVIGDIAVQYMSLTVSRRLALAAADGKASGLLVLNRNSSDATASASRWCVAALPSAPRPHDAKAPGFPAWEVALTRIRGGRPGQWPLIWNPPSTLLSRHDDTPPHFTLVPGISGGALYQGAPESPETQPAAEPALRFG